MNNKICSLYASDAHLITMINSYINNYENVITILEKDLSAIANKINIKNINWNKSCIEEILENNNFENKTIIINGKCEFIEDINKVINPKIENCNKIEIINCYYIFEKNIKIKEILSNYTQILTTQGIEKLSNKLVCNI